MMKSWKTYLIWTIPILLGLLCIKRLAQVFQTMFSPFIYWSDFSQYYMVSQSVRLGLNPYDPQVYTAYYDAVPVVPPSLTIMILPLTLLPLALARWLFFIVSLVLIPWLWAIIYFHYFSPSSTNTWITQFSSKALKILKLGSPHSHTKKATEVTMDSPLLSKEAPAWHYAAISFFLFCASAPIHQTLALGQISIIVSFLLTIGLLAESGYLKGIAMGLAIALKPSFIPMILLLLVGKHKTKATATAILLLALICLAPVFFGYDLVNLYQGYGTSVKVLSSRHLDFVMDGCRDRIDLNFWKANFLNQTFQLCSIGLLLWIIWRERKRESLSMDAFLFGTILSLGLVYHRLQDAVLLVALASAFICHSLIGGHLRWTLILGSLLLIFSVVPNSILQHFSDWLGFLLEKNSIITIGKSLQENPPRLTVFPLWGTVMFFFLVIVGYLCIFKRYSYLKKG